MTFNELVAYVLTDRKLINSSQSLSTPHQQYAAFFADYNTRTCQLIVGDILHGIKQYPQATWRYSYINDKVKKTVIIHG